MRGLALIAAALALTACAAQQEDGPSEGSTPTARQGAGASAPSLTPGEDPDPATGPTTEPQASAAAAPRYAPGDVPVIYMAIEDGGSREHSAVFAVDQDGDGSARDEQAIRITPQPTGDGTSGQCNPQNLTRYDFADGSPVFDHDVANANEMEARELPRFLSFAVAQALLRTGLAETEEETVPLNICTRKLWETLLVQSQPEPGASG